jgi:hypothetical protein
MGVMYTLPFMKDASSPLARIAQDWQINGIFAAFSGTPYSIDGTNPDLNCPGCGSIFINVSGDPKPAGSVGSSTEPYYPVEIFSQPTGASVDGFGNSGRDRFRRPPVWNADLSLFKAFQLGRVRPEIRFEAANIFNHPNWGAPVTTFTANNFMLFTPSSYDGGGGSTNTPGPRRFQVGLRFQFCARFSRVLNDMCMGGPSRPAHIVLRTCAGSIGHDETRRSSQSKRPGSDCAKTTHRVTGPRRTAPGRSVTFLRPLKAFLQRPSYCWSLTFSSQSTAFPSSCS